MNSSLEIIYVGLNTLINLGGLMLGCALLVGFLVAFVQAATNIQDISIAYAAKLLSLIALSYFLMPYFTRALLDLAQRSFAL